MSRCPWPTLQSSRASLGPRRQGSTRLECDALPLSYTRVPFGLTRGGTRTRRRRIMVVVLSAFVAGPNPLVDSLHNERTRVEACDDNGDKTKRSTLELHTRSCVRVQRDSNPHISGDNGVVLSAFVAGLGPRASIHSRSSATIHGPKRQEIARSDPRVTARSGTRTRTPFGSPMESRRHSLRADDRRPLTFTSGPRGPRNAARARVPRRRGFVESLHMGMYSRLHSSRNLHA